MSKKVIAFSVWGNNPIYTIGAIKNADLKNQYFPDWELWVYHDNTVPQEIITQLQDKKCRTFNYSGRLNQGFAPATWRFLTASSPEVELFISRDADSRIGPRDVSAVKDWVESGKNIHIIREHPVGHNWAINAGMWGCRGGVIPNMEQLVTNYLASADSRIKEFDQHFLGDVIYPNYATQSSFVHDEFTPSKEPHAVPIKRDLELDDFAFIGESIDENDNDRWEREPGEQRAGIKSYYYAK